MRSNAVAIAITIAAVAGAQGSSAPWQLPNFSDRVSVTLTNPSGAPMQGLAIADVRKLRASAPSFPGTLSIAVDPSAGMHFVPLQTDDVSGDGDPDEIALEVSLPPHASKTIDIYYSTTLRDEMPWPKRVHASHAYGYNHATAALESEKIGYRTYGGFFFDVQAHAAGHTGLLNSVLGYSRTAHPPAAGRDIVHYGNTLGLGGIYLKAGDQLYRPPLNTPDYTHRERKPGEPVYRIVSAGPLRAIVEARVDSWRIGKDEVALRGLYEIRAGEECVRAHVWVTPKHTSSAYIVGAGVLALPAMRLHRGKDMLAVAGTQDKQLGQIALGLSFSPSAAVLAGNLQTLDGGNEAVRFRGTLAVGKPMEAVYNFAAAWDGSGWPDPLQHVVGVLEQSQQEILVKVGEHASNPSPASLEGEPN